MKDATIPEFKEAYQAINKFFSDIATLLSELFLKSIKKTGLLGCVSDYPSSLEATHAIINIFKDWVENNRGWAEIQDAPTKKREKAVQRFMHLGAKYYVENNNLDFSCEADEGRGPFDIKLSRGTDKTIAEIKLSSNGQYLHGIILRFQNTVVLKEQRT